MIKYKYQNKLRMNMRVIIFLLFGLLITGLISAEGNQPTSQYNKIFLNPFYRASMISGINYTYNFTINPPDKVSSVSSAIIQIDVYLTPTVNYNLWVNGIVCNNPIFTVSTTYAGASQGTLYFDCSNVIKQAGIYTITLRADKNSGSSTAWVDLTYTNNPKGSITIHGTEYKVGESVKLWLQLVNSSGSDISDGVCYLDIYTPHNELFVERATMSNLNHDGIYYYDLVAPTHLGVFPAIAKCYYIASQDKKNMSSYIMTSGKLNSGTVISTQALDEVYLDISTDKNGGFTTNNRVNLTFNSTNFYTSCSNVSESLLTSISFGWTGIWNTNTISHDIILYVFNYTSQSWINLSNKIVSGHGGSIFSVTNSITTNNITKLLGITSSKQMLIRTVDTDINEGAKHFQTDYLYASCDQLTSPNWEVLRGSSEMHITSNNEYNFGINTLCDENELSSACSIMDGVMEVGNITLYEGTLTDNITIINTANILQSSDIHYITPPKIDCTAFVSASLYDSATDTTIDISEDIIFEKYLDSNCELHIPIYLQSNSTIQTITLIFDNYLKWEVLRGKNIRDSINNTLGFCLSYANLKNFTYTVPLISEPIINDSILLYCARTMDDFWFFDYYYDLSQNISIIGEYESYHYEIIDYYLPLILKENDYIQLNLHPYVNTSYTTLIQSVPQYVWDYNNRSLTDFNFTVNASINTTVITQDIWAFNGTVNPNLQFQLTNGSCVNGICNINGTLVAKNIWEYPGTINVNLLVQLAQTMWEYTARYIHGTLLS